MWAGTGGEGSTLDECAHRHHAHQEVCDAFFLVCDGLRGLPEVVSNVWPLTTVQTCVIHLIRNTFKLAAKQHWDGIKRATKPIYTASDAVRRQGGVG